MLRDQMKVLQRMWLNVIYHDTKYSTGKWTQLCDKLMYASYQMHKFLYFLRNIRILVIINAV